MSSEAEKKFGDLKPFYTSEQLEKFDKLRNLPYEKKLEMSHEIIQEAFRRFKRLAVACSFGKDSVAVLHMVRQYDPNILVVFSNTGVEMRETLEYRDFLVKEWNLNYIEAKPQWTFWRIVKRYGYPATRFMTKEKMRLIREGKVGKDSIPKCCELLKEQPAREIFRKKHIECVFFGITWDESYNRKWTIIRYGTLFYHKSHRHWKCYPIGYWNTADVWRYIEENNIPVNPAYEKVDRVGCITCTAYKDWEKDMAKLYPGLYRKIARDLGRPTLDDFLGGGKFGKKDSRRGK